MWLRRGSLPQKAAHAITIVPHLVHCRNGVPRTLAPVIPPWSNVSVESFATDALGVSANQCPLWSVSDQSGHAANDAKCHKRTFASKELRSGITSQAFGWAQGTKDRFAGYTLPPS